MEENQIAIKIHKLKLWEAIVGLSAFVVVFFPLMMVWALWTEVRRGDFPPEIWIMTGVILGFVIITVPLIFRKKKNLYYDPVQKNLYCTFPFAFFGRRKRHNIGCPQMTNLKIENRFLRDRIDYCLVIRLGAFQDQSEYEYRVAGLHEGRRIGRDIEELTGAPFADRTGVPEQKPQKELRR